MMKVVQKILQSFQIKLLLLLVVALQALYAISNAALKQNTLLYPVSSDLSSQSACVSYSDGSSPKDADAYNLGQCSTKNTCNEFSGCIVSKAQSEENILSSTNQASGLLNALTKLNLASINFINYVGTCLEYGTSTTAGKEAKQVSCKNATGGITSQVTSTANSVAPPSWSPNYNPILATPNLTGAIRQGILNVLATSQLAILFPAAPAVTPLLNVLTSEEINALAGAIDPSSISNALTTNQLALLFPAAPTASPLLKVLTSLEIINLAQKTDPSNKSSYTTAANSFGQVQSVFTDILNNPQGAAITLLLQTIPVNAGSSGNLINFASAINTNITSTNFTYKAFNVVATQIQTEIASGTNTAAQLIAYLSNSTNGLKMPAKPEALTTALSQPVSQTIAQFLAQWGTIKQVDITKKASDIENIISSAQSSMANSLLQVQSFFTDILNNPQGAAITLLLQTIPGNAGSGSLINFASSINTNITSTNFTYKAFNVVASNIQYEIANGTNSTAAQLSTYLTSQTVTLPSAAQLTTALSQPVSQTIAQFLAQWGAIKQGDITKKASGIEKIISSAKPYTPIFNSATVNIDTIKSTCKANASSCQNIFVTAFEASNQSPAPIVFSPGILNPNKNLPTTIQQLDEFLQQYACCVILSQKLANDQAYCVANNFTTVIDEISAKTNLNASPAPSVGSKIKNAFTSAGSKIKNVFKKPSSSLSSGSNSGSSSSSGSGASSFAPSPSIVEKLNPAIFTQLDFTDASTYTMVPIDPAADGSNTGSQMFFPVIMDWVNCDEYKPQGGPEWQLCMSGSAGYPPSGIGAQVQLLQNTLAPANIALQKFIFMQQMVSAYQGQEFGQATCTNLSTIQGRLTLVEGLSTFVFLVFMGAQQFHASWSARTQAAKAAEQASKDRQVMIDLNQELTDELKKINAVQKYAVEVANTCGKR